MDILGGGGHHKTGLVLGVISMHFRVFVQKEDILGLLIFFLFVCLIFQIFFLFIYFFFFFFFFLGGGGG